RMFLPIFQSLKGPAVAPEGRSPSVRYAYHLPSAAARRTVPPRNAVRRPARGGTPHPNAAADNTWRGHLTAVNDFITQYRLIVAKRGAIRRLQGAFLRNRR